MTPVLHQELKAIRTLRMFSELVTDMAPTLQCSIDEGKMHFC